MSFLFRDQSWLQIEEYLKQKTLVILPVGTTEEHGWHLPVDTDARIADAYGARLAEALLPEMPVLVMDSIRYGYSMKIMQQWPGTIVVRSRVVMDMIFDVCKSILDMGFEKLALLDCHGHHGSLLGTIMREIGDACNKGIAVIQPSAMSRDEFVAIRKSVQGGAIHGGEWETSLLLHISPEVVDMSKVTNQDIMRYHSDFVAGDTFSGRQRVGWSTWFLQPSKTGTYGDPTVASAETGKIIMDAAVANGARFLKEFFNH